MKVARTVWILTKFKRIVRDGEEAKIEAAQEKLINSAKDEVANLVENETIKKHLSEKVVTYEDNSATVHLNKALAANELGEINGTGIMASIEKVFEDNEDLDSVTVSIIDNEIVTISRDKIELAEIKQEIIDKFLTEGLNNNTVVNLVAKGDSLGDKGVTYTVNFKVTEEKED